MISEVAAAVAMTGCLLGFISHNYDAVTALALLAIGFKIDILTHTTK